MPTRIVPFTPDRLPAVLRFSERMWSRPTDEAYLRWRYLECPSQLGILALDETDACQAMVWAFRRPWRVRDRRVHCLETADWFTLPEQRASMLGVRVIRTLMQQPEPIVAVGGSEHTVGLLPGLRWRPVGRVTSFALPLGGRSVGRVVARRFGIPAALVETVYRGTARHWFGSARAPAPAGGSVLRTDSIGDDVVALHDQEQRYVLLPALDPELARWWLAAPPALGATQVLRFVVEGRLAGWSLARIHDGLSGREATVIELFAPGDDAALHAWMVSETVAGLREHAPDVIHASASAAPIRAALRRARFLTLRDHPVHLWGHPEGGGEGPIHVGNNTSDTPIFPAPTALPEINHLTSTAPPA